MPKMFVYGTLMSVNNGRMENLGCHTPTPAELKGFTLYQVDPNFPGIIPEPGGMVLGELWDVPKEAIPELDYYEGVDAGLYRREKTEVEAVGGKKEKAFIYVWNRKPRGRKVPFEEQPWRPGWEEDDWGNEED